jgi:hypothetical protein
MLYTAAILLSAERASGRGTYPSAHTLGLASLHTPTGVLFLSTAAIEILLRVAQIIVCLYVRRCDLFVSLTIRPNVVYQPEVWCGATEGTSVAWRTRTPSKLACRLHTQGYMHTHIHAHAHTCTRKGTCTRTYMHTQGYKHTHIHARKPGSYATGDLRWLFHMYWTHSNGRIDQACWHTFQAPKRPTYDITETWPSADTWLVHFP